MRFLWVIFGCLALTATDRKPDNIFSLKAVTSHYNLTDSVSTQQLQGKSILVEFWASWCQPCRVKNGELNHSYTKLKNQNFEIVSVALDTDSLRWRKAIRNDKLKWTVHARDTAKWESVMLKFAGVSHLPYNILFDSNGNVVAREVYGEELEKQVTALQ